MHISFKWLAAATVVGFIVAPGLAQAESFSKLSRQDHAISKLTRGKSGGYGWVVSTGGKRFFCRLNVSLAYINKKEMMSITSSGRQIKVDRATFEASIGGHDPSIPNWSDLQSGKVVPANVGSCSPLR